MSPLSKSGEAPRSSSVPFLIGCCAILLLVEFVGLYYMRSPPRWNDFRSFYAAGTILRTHPSSLYDLAVQAQVQDALVSHNGVVMTFYHPSYEALLFAPFTFLPFRAAYGAFMAFSVLCLIAAFYAARPLFSEKISFLQARPGLMLVFFIPITGAIGWGQDSMVFLLLFCLTWRQLQNRRDLSAGCILALALFRLQLALPLAILIATRRGWRFAAGFLAAAAGVLLLCIALVGRAGMAALFALLTGATLVKGQDLHSQQLMKVHPPQMANLAGLLYIGGTRYLPPHIAFAVIAFASLCVFVWTILQVRRAHQDRVAFAMAILCSILVSYHFLPYDLSFLIPALALLAHRVPSLVLAAMYWLPVALFLSLGTHSLFLFALPLLALLVYAGTVLNKQNDTLIATPLYT